MKLKTKMQIWIFTGILLVFGFLPYRYSFKRPSKDSTNLIIAEYQDCTCCGDLTLIKGKLNIPDSLQTIYNFNEYEYTLSHTSDIPMFGYGTTGYDMLVSNRLIVEGKIIGANRTHETGCGANPILSVKSWHLITYYPRFLVLPFPLMIGYVFLEGFMIVLSGLILLIRPKKNKNE